MTARGRSLSRASSAYEMFPNRVCAFGRDAVAKLGYIETHVP